ncbi:MAG: single-strand DNA-binding protein [Actinomycetota bacterium]|jgi:single-strand DNA-binding protein|nr:single-strand DNA-binding protein [Actinomycetota bacterium]MDQ1668051.1 single-strand DNA-binding protein [Actinomycetota bacterium]
MAATARESVAVDHTNEVHLVGRLSAQPEQRELPSGDCVVTFRLVVARGRPTRSSARSPTVDTIDCAVWTKGAQRSLRSCHPGDLVEVRGALRRRFWRAAHGPSSRSEVEVTTLRRAAKAPAADPAGDP